MHKLTRTPSEQGRRRLFSRTALCGALFGIASLSPIAAHAQTTTAPILPTGGFADVNAGGGAPVITTGIDSVNVKLNAPRTILSWTTYNLSADASVNYTFDANNWIVLNKIIGLAPSKIEGTITGKVGADFGGNIWFVSNNSIIFGRTAQVDAGAFLAAIGTVDTAKFLDASNTLFSFAGGDALPNSTVFVLGGGQIHGHGGLVAFAAPSIVTRANAVVT